MKKKFLHLAFILLLSSISFGQAIYKMSGLPLPPPNASVTTFELLVTHIGNNNATIIIDTPVILNTIVIPPATTATTIVGRNITLEFYNGNIITAGNSVVLTLNCPIKAGMFQIFNCTGTGTTNGSPFIDQCYPHWWAPNNIGQSASWSNYIQRAVDFYPRVYFPSRELYKGYHLDNTIFLDLSRHATASYYIYGDGGGSYFETSPYPSFTGFVFKTKNTPVAGHHSGIIFENLSFFCKNGIQITGGHPTSENFTNEEYPIANVRISNCKFRENSYTEQNPYVSNTGIAIYFRKIFDSQISNNVIEGFGYGVKFDGVDISSIRDNRIQHFFNYAILDGSFTTSTVNIGSQNSIFHNDILVYEGVQNKNAFIKTTSNHVLIRDNYLENQSTHKPLAFIDCSLVDMPLNSEFGTVNHYSYHIDITGNRLDSSNETTNFAYYINENFKSLNLVEIPTYNSSPTIKAWSTFVKMVPPSGGGLYTGIPVNRIPVKVDGQTAIDKLINMKNCFSFKNWENFSTSNVFADHPNGDFIIDSKTISAISDITGNPIPPTFNPRGFLLGAGSAGCPCPGIAMRVDQNTDFPGEFSDIFTNMIIKLKVRNLPPYSADPTDDLYLRIDELISGSWTTKYTNSSIDVKNGTAYSVIKIVIPTSILFDASKRYQLSISSKSNYVKEFKEIIFENSGTVATDSSAKQANPGNSLIKEVVESETPAEETIQTLTVKVDNDVIASPNPVQSNLTIDVKKGDVVKSIEIYTASGAFIGDYTNRANNNIIDISSLPSATYVVKVVTIANTSKIIVKE